LDGGFDKSQALDAVFHGRKRAIDLVAWLLLDPGNYGSR
jgi:hypothetical protein